MDGVFATEFTKFLELQAFRFLFFVLCAAIISPTTFGTFKLDMFAHETIFMANS